MKTLEEAIIATLTYADIFDYPLTISEIHYYLVECKSTPNEISQVIEHSISLREKLSIVGKYYTLRGHEKNVSVRLKREELSSRLWPKALRYGSWIAALPFIQMVALTGSLAVYNANSQADIDFMLVTRRGRLWTTRAMVILLVRLAARQGDIICPNYFISEDNLVLSDRSLFTAHEVVQMIPIAGLTLFQKLLELNPWTQDYLPNAKPQYAELHRYRIYQHTIKPLLEALLNEPVISKVESWEMNRKIRRFSEQSVNHPEACFRPDICKGHLDDHGFYTQRAFHERMRVFEEAIK